MSFNFKDYTTIQETVSLTLIDLNWYKAKYQVPTTKNGIEQDQMISKWIVNATEQVDSLCNGRLTTDIPKFSPESTQDAKELAIVQSCVGDLVEYFIMTGRMFADLDKSVQSAVPFDVKSKSNDANLEEKRLDILRKLSTTRFYKTYVSNDISTNNVYDTETYTNDILDPTSEDFQTLVGRLRNYFLTNDNTNKQNGNILFSKNYGDNNNTENENRQIIGSSHIKSNAWNQSLPPSFYPSIFGYRFSGTVVNSEQAKKIEFDDGYYSLVELVDKYGLAFFGAALDQALTRQEVYNLIQANNLTWRVDFVYELGVLVFYEYIVDSIKYIGQAISLTANNIGNNPADESVPFVNWDIITSSAVDVTGIVNDVLTQVEPLLPALIETEFNKLDTITYTSEYPNQTLTFETEADYTAYKLASGTTNADYVDIPVIPIPVNLVTTDTAQTITGLKTHQLDNEAMTLKALTGDSACFLAFKNAANERFGYFGKNSNTSNAMIFAAEKGNVEFQAASGSSVVVKNTLNIGGNYIANVKTPSSAADGANKGYVDTTVETAIDTAVLDLVNTKTAQSITGVKTFTEPVKAPTPIVSNDLTTKNYVDQGFVTTNTNQTIEGDKTFRGKVQVQAPTSPADATTKNYVDGGFVTINTDQIVEGIKNFSGLVFVIEPTDNSSPTTKRYVDNAVSVGSKPWEEIPYTVNTTTNKLDFNNAADKFYKIQVFGGWDDITGGDYVNVVTMTWEAHNDGITLSGIGYNSDATKFASFGLSQRTLGLSFALFAPTMPNLKVYGIRR